MNTVTVWVLVATFGGYSPTYPSQTVIVDNIASAADCKKLAAEMKSTKDETRSMTCHAVAKAKL